MFVFAFSLYIWIYCIFSYFDIFKMKWLVIYDPSNPSQVHILPNSSDFEHTEDDSCCCNPSKQKEGHKTIFKHKIKLKGSSASDS